MSDLIRRQDAIKALYKYSFVSKDVIEREINAIPSADRLQGEWLEVINSDIECSVCGERWGLCDNDTERFNYCPSCGAIMKGADDDMY